MVLLKNGSSRFKIQSISLPEGLIKEADKAANDCEISRSDLYRRAIEIYIHKLSWQKIREYAVKKAANLGITNDDQIVDLIDSFRKEKKAN